MPSSISMKCRFNLTKVTVDFYQEGQWGGKLSSTEGTIYLEDVPNRNIAKNDFILLGNVLYKGKDGSTVSVPRLRLFGQAKPSDFRRAALSSSGL